MTLNNLQCHSLTIILFKCDIRTVVTQLTRFQLIDSVARSLCDSWSSSCQNACMPIWNCYSQFSALVSLAILNGATVHWSVESPADSKTDTVYGDIFVRWREWLWTQEGLRPRRVWTPYTGSHSRHPRPDVGVHCRRGKMPTSKMWRSHGRRPTKGPSGPRCGVPLSAIASRGHAGSGRRSAGPWNRRGVERVDIVVRQVDWGIGRPACRRRRWFVCLGNGTAAVSRQRKSFSANYCTDLFRVRLITCSRRILASKVRTLRRHRNNVYIMIKHSDVTLIYGHDTISMMWGMISYCTKLTGKDLTPYLNKTESVSLQKAWCYSARSAIWLQMLLNVFISLSYVVASRTAGINKNEEITSLCCLLLRQCCRFGQ